MHTRGTNNHVSTIELFTIVDVEIAPVKRISQYYAPSARHTGALMRLCDRSDVLVPYAIAFQPCRRIKRPACTSARALRNENSAVREQGTRALVA